MIDFLSSSVFFLLFFLKDWPVHVTSDKDMSLSLAFEVRICAYRICAFCLLLHIKAQELF
jgi:hypothetical protein